MSYAYLACPYTHEEDSIRQDRFFLACEATALLMARGYQVLCPIVHGHAVSRFLSDEVQGHNFWAHQCAPLLGCCDTLLVLMLDGWSESAGVRHEINHALQHGLDIEWFTLDDLRDGALPTFALRDREDGKRVFGR